MKSPAEDTTGGIPVSRALHPQTATQTEVLGSMPIVGAISFPNYRRGYAVEKRDGKMAGKVALVTGAGGGIARGVARAFAEEGANVVITDVLQEGLDETKAGIETDYGAEVLDLLVDGADEEKVIDAIDQTIDSFGRLDVIVNCADAGISGVPLLEHTLEHFELAMSTALYATFYYMKHGYPHLKETEGSVINFGSGAGISGSAGQASYGPAKEGIRSLSRVAANEWGPDNINVNVILPLVMTEKLVAWAEEHPEMYEKNVKAIPLGRFGDAQKDVGATCVFLASPGGSFITGETIMMQGGSGMRA